MRERDRQNKQRRKGFTLAELLVVVAIIGVLVGVAIPVLNTQLEKAREAVDLAHLRQALSAGVAYFITNPVTNKQISRKFYNIQTGELLEWVVLTSDGKVAQNTLQGYGKGTKVNGLGLWTENGIKYNGNLDVRDCVIMVTGDRDGNVCCGWVNPNYTIKADPFKLFAKLYDNTDNKTYLYPTRSASGSTDNLTNVEINQSNYLQLDRDTFKFFNQDKNMDEIDDMYYTLEMYYIMMEEFVNDTDIRMNLRLAILKDTYQTTLDEKAGTNTKPYFFDATKFQKKMYSAESVTLATQFWAKVAEYTGIDMKQFQSIADAVTAPTGKTAASSTS